MRQNWRTVLQFVKKLSKRPNFVYNKWRKTREVVNVAYHWFLGYELPDEILRFATVSYAFCKRFPKELTSEIFEHILNKTLNNRMVDLSIIFLDGTHIKASTNKKKFRKEKVAKAARIYSEQLWKEVNAEWAKP